MDAKLNGFTVPKRYISTEGKYPKSEVNNYFIIQKKIAY